MKILMVCLGNICRSPLAEGIMKSKLTKDCMVDSAGTIAMHQGSRPDHRSIKAAANHGIDISQQISRPITIKDLDDFDYIFCMDKSNLYDVLAMAKTQEQKSKIHLILDNQKEVPDPYYGDFSDFEAVFSLLDEACTRKVQEIFN